MGVSPCPSISKLLVSAFRCRCLAWISSQVREDDLGSTRRVHYTLENDEGTAVPPKVMEVWFFHSLKLTAKASENRPTPKRKGSSSFPIHFQVRIWLVSGRVHDFCLSIGWLWLCSSHEFSGGYHSISLRSETPLLAILGGEGVKAIYLAVGKIPPNQQLRHRSFRYHNTQVK